MKVRVHPLFPLSVLLYLFFGGVGGYLLAFLAITLHELAHCLVALLTGAEDLSLLLMPCGAVLIAKGELPHFVVVLLSGPFFNLILASFTLSACWLFPELYGYFKGFITTNVLLAALNLLPAYPLDGGRLLRTLFPAKWARIVTAAFTSALGALSFVAFFTTYRITYLIFGVFLLLSLVAPLFFRRNRVKEDDPLYLLARTDEEGRLRPASVKRGRGRSRLTREQVTALLLSYPPRTAIAVALGEKGYK